MAEKIGAGFTDLLAAWRFLENSGINRLTINIDGTPSKRLVYPVYHLKCDAGGKKHESLGSTFEEAVMKLAEAVYATLMNRSPSKGG